MVERIKQILTQRNLRLKVAESFTGGYLTSLITQIKGASEYLIESIICYNIESKIKRLNVKAETIQNYGAVSANTLREMLLGLLNSGSCDIALSTTGNASDSSEEFTKKGDCFIGIATRNQKNQNSTEKNSTEIKILRFSFKGTRKQIIKKGSIEALNLLINLIE